SLGILLEPVPPNPAGLVWHGFGTARVPAERSRPQARSPRPFALHGAGLGFFPHVAVQPGDGAGKNRYGDRIALRPAHAGRRVAGAYFQRDPGRMAAYPRRRAASHRATPSAGESTYASAIDPRSHRVYRPAESLADRIAAAPSCQREETPQDGSPH